MTHPEGSQRGLSSDYGSDCWSARRRGCAPHARLRAPICRSGRSSMAIASRRCARLPSASVDLVFADPPYNLQLGGDLVAPRWQPCRCGDRSLGPVRQLRHLRQVHPRMADRSAPGAQAQWLAVGDRQLSQHLPGRRDPAGHGVLDPQRRGLAQGQPDAQFQGHPLHQRARNADLGVDGREGEATPSTTAR